MIRIFHTGWTFRKARDHVEDWLMGHEGDPIRETASGLWRLDKENYPGFELWHEVYTEWWALDRMVRQLVGKPHDKWVMLHLPGGREVQQHVHNDWGTVVYYPDGHASKLTVSDEGEEPVPVPTEGGDLVVMPAGQAHGVQANDTQATRVSFVYLFGHDKATKEGVASLARPQIPWQEEAP